MYAVRRDRLRALPTTIGLSKQILSPLILSRFTVPRPLAVAATRADLCSVPRLDLTALLRLRLLLHTTPLSYIP